MKGERLVEVVKKNLLVVMFSCATVLVLLLSIGGDRQISAANIVQTPQPVETLQMLNSTDDVILQYLTIQHTYNEKNITINYPQISGLSNRVLQVGINKLIKNEALNCLENSRSVTDQFNDYCLKIDYLLKWHSANLLSIAYSGYGYTPGYAGNRKFYTTNIDMNNGQKLRLKDMVIIDKNFIDKLKNGKFIAVDPVAKEIIATDEFTDAKLLEKLNGADATSEGGTYSYFTKDALGISFEVPHVIGDQIIFELQYQDIIDNIKISNPAWRY